MNHRFHAVHQQTYGYAAPEEPTQFINFRVTAIGLTGRPLLKPASRPAGHTTPRPLTQRQVYFGEAQGFLPCPIYARQSLFAGDVVTGPAIVEQMDATTVIHPGQQVTVDEYGNLLLES